MVKTSVMPQAHEYRVLVMGLDWMSYIIFALLLL